MKTLQKVVAVLLLIVAPFIVVAQQQEDPWKPDQLMEPADLAQKIENNAPNVYIFNIGPAGSIKNAIEIGDGKEKESQTSIEEQLINLPKDTEIVIYCGCCPFVNCPNVRPIFNTLNEQQFVNHKLLNLPKNLKVDWIDKGFPMSK
jgi:hypothetical protein